MIDATVPISRAISILAWALGVGFLIAGWAVYLSDYADLGLMLAVTGIPFIAIAGLMMVRCWAARVCQVVRTTASRGGDDGIVPLR